jgi:hypothetical protein
MTLLKLEEYEQNLQIDSHKCQFFYPLNYTSKHRSVSLLILVTFNMSFIYLNYCLSIHNVGFLVNAFCVALP